MVGGYWTSVGTFRKIGFDAISELFFHHFATRLIVLHPDPVFVAVLELTLECHVAVLIPFDVLALVDVLTVGILSLIALAISFDGRIPGGVAPGRTWLGRGGAG